MSARTKPSPIYIKRRISLSRCYERLYMYTLLIHTLSLSLSPSFSGQPRSSRATRRKPTLPSQTNLFLSLSLSFSLLRSIYVHTSSCLLLLLPPSLLLLPFTFSLSLSLFLSVHYYRFVALALTTCLPCEAPFSLLTLSRLLLFLSYTYTDIHPSTSC